MFRVDENYTHKCYLMTEKGNKFVNGIFILEAKIKCLCELDLKQKN